MPSLRLSCSAWVGSACVCACACLLAALLTVAIMPASAVSTGGQARSLRVLAVGKPDWSAILALQAYLESPALQAAGLPAVAMDLIRHDSQEQVLADLRARRHRLADYAAIYVASIGTARMIQQEVRDLPIVFEGVDDAVKRCLIDSVQRPGRNATGYMHVLEDTEPRMMQLLHDAFPALKQVVVLASGTNVRRRGCDDGPQPLQLAGCRPGLHDNDDTVQQIMAPERLLEQGLRQALKVRFLVLCGSADFARLHEFVGPDSGVLVPWQNLFDSQDAALVEALSRLRRPAISARQAFAKAGGLMALSVQLPPVLPRESLRLLTQVLQGQATATLPVSTPYGMRLTINARSALAQGLRPSIEVWQRADEVLE